MALIIRHLPLIISKILNEGVSKTSFREETFFLHQLFLVFVSCHGSSDSSVNSMIKANVRSRYSVHELFGFDIMLDENLKPWIIEVNVSPRWLYVLLIWFTSILECFHSVKPTCMLTKWVSLTWNAIESVSRGIYCSSWIPAILFEIEIGIKESF